MGSSSILAVNSQVTDMELLVGVIVPVSCVILIAVISLFSYILRKLSAHDTALAVILQQLNPAGEKSLREVLHEIQMDLARNSSSNSGA